MSPQERREFEEMKATIKRLEQVVDLPFIKNIQRRVVQPILDDDLLSEVSDSTTSGILESVSEGGSGVYDVAAAYDDAKIINIGGTNWKIGVYIP